MVEPQLRVSVAELPAEIRLVAGYHLGWWDEAGTALTAAGGKAIRPALTLLAAEAVGGAAGAAVPAAVAVELIHNFSLLHDDVLDGDDTRRHRPTAWRVFGVGPAVLAGDALLIAAGRALTASTHPAASEAMQMLSDATLDLLGGERADIAFEGRDAVGVAECLAMVEGKTAALLASSCAVGGLLGGGDAARVACLRDFGRALGVAYQHVDDLLGIWGEPSITGKPVHADLRSRKKTLPVVAALASGTPEGEEFAALYGQRRVLSDAELAHAAHLVEASGARAWSQAQATLLFHQALEHLHAVAPATRAGAELVALARLAAHRDR
ncbi:polyprenyl synthetase family protein [Lentzea sp. NPDC051208]|uniref:polyprenyl synthetase family protein n=1 Tax=Lentzea sp. NPDC051208 TaxID=3154642 RepID=UPI00341C9427